MKTKILTILLLAASVAIVSLMYYYERKISGIVDNYELEMSLMTERDSLICEFYYVSGEINATKDSVKLDSLREVSKERYDKLSIVTQKLCKWGKK